MRLIDADALKKKAVMCPTVGNAETLLLDISDVENAPTIEERKGKWIFGETIGHSWMKCSECCVSQDGQTACFTYCPNCGARMEGAEE